MKRNRQQLRAKKVAKERKYGEKKPAKRRENYAFKKSLSNHRKHPGYKGRRPDRRTELEGKEESDEESSSSEQGELRQVESQPHVFYVPSLSTMVTNADDILPQGPSVQSFPLNLSYLEKSIRNVNLADALNLDTSLIDSAYSGAEVSPSTLQTSFKRKFDLRFAPAVKIVEQEATAISRPQMKKEASQGATATTSVEVVEKSVSVPTVAMDSSSPAPFTAEAQASFDKLLTGVPDAEPASASAADIDDLDELDALLDL